MALEMSAFTSTSCKVQTQTYFPIGLQKSVMTQAKASQKSSTVFEDEGYCCHVLCRLKVYLRAWSWPLKDKAKQIVILLSK